MHISASLQGGDRGQYTGGGFRVAHNCKLEVQSLASQPVLGGAYRLPTALACVRRDKAIRCHPYVLAEINATRETDRAKASRDFDLKYFNEGNYIKAVEDKNESENLSKVLYAITGRISGNPRPRD